MNLSVSVSSLMNLLNLGQSKDEGGNGDDGFASLLDIGKDDKEQIDTVAALPVAAAPQFEKPRPEVPETSIIQGDTDVAPERAEQQEEFSQRLDTPRRDDKELPRTKTAPKELKEDAPAKETRAAEKPAARKEEVEAPKATEAQTAEKVGKPAPTKEVANAKEAAPTEETKPEDKYKGVKETLAGLIQTLSDMLRAMGATPVAAKVSVSVETSVSTQIATLTNAETGETYTYASQAMSYKATFTATMIGLQDPNAATVAQMNDPQLLALLQHAGDLSAQMAELLAGAAPGTDKAAATTVLSQMHSSLFAATQNVEPGLAALWQQANGTNAQATEAGSSDLSLDQLLARIDQLGKNILAAGKTGYAQVTQTTTVQTVSASVGLLRQLSPQDAAKVFAQVEGFDSSRGPILGEAKHIEGSEPKTSLPDQLSAEASVEITAESTQTQTNAAPKQENMNKPSDLALAIANAVTHPTARKEEPAKDGKTEAAVAVAPVIETKQAVATPQNIQVVATQNATSVTASASTGNGGSDLGGNNQGGQQNQATQTPTPAAVNGQAQNASAAYKSDFAAKLEAVRTPVTEQVAFSIKTAASNGQSRITIHLSPEDLGRLDVKIHITEGGKTNVTITAENKETLAMLQRDAQNLMRSLADSGLQTDSGSLSFNLRGEQQQHSEGRQAAQTYQKIQPEDEDDQALSIISRNYVVNLADGLDIKI